VWLKDLWWQDCSPAAVSPSPRGFIPDLIRDSVPMSNLFYEPLRSDRPSLAPGPFFSPPHVSPRPLRHQTPPLCWLFSRPSAPFGDDEVFWSSPFDLQKFPPISPFRITSQFAGYAFFKSPRYNLVTSRSHRLSGRFRSSFSPREKLATLEIGDIGRRAFQSSLEMFPFLTQQRSRGRDSISILRMRPQGSLTPP